MSGLWSFRETGTLPVCLSDAARRSLPAASDDITCAVLTEDSAALMLDPVSVFSVAADVDAAVQEVQNEWLERTVGCLTTSPYHVQPKHQEALQSVSRPTDAGPSSLAGCDDLDVEDIEVLRKLLESRSTSGKKKVGAQLRRRFHPTAPAPPSLHTAELASRRERRRSLSTANEAANSAVAVGAEDSHRDVKCTPDRARGTLRLTPCSFVERMERRAEQRRRARSQLGVPRMPDTHVVEVPPPNAREVLPVDEIKTNPVLFNNAFVLGVQTAPISLETAMSTADTGIDCRHTHEALAHQRHCVQLNEPARRCWCHTQRSRGWGFACNPISMLACTTNTCCLPASTEEGPALSSRSLQPVVMFSVRSMQLLRWYFVLWVAAVETARDGQAVVKRQKRAELMGS